MRVSMRMPDPWRGSAPRGFSGVWWWQSLGQCHTERLRAPTRRGANCPIRRKERSVGSISVERPDDASTRELEMTNREQEDRERFEREVRLLRFKYQEQRRVNGLNPGAYDRLLRRPKPRHGAIPGDEAERRRLIAEFKSRQG